MLRGSRSPDSGPSSESYGPSGRSHQELLLAVAPLPSAPEFRISGWPSWLVPGHFTLSRAVQSRNQRSDPY
jgi:hypothetical protein